MVARTRLISTYARVSKGQASDIACRAKLAGDKSNPQAGSKKRKAVAIEDDTPLMTPVPSLTESYIPNQVPKRQRVCEAKVEIAEAATSSSVSTDPHHTIVGLFSSPLKNASLKANRNSRPTSSTTHRINKSVSRDAKKPGRVNTVKIEELFLEAQQHKSPLSKKKAVELPQVLAELASLHRAFMKTVVIHIAHNGPHAPIDIRAIAPNISRAWGKRQVTIEDIRRCIAVQNFPATSGDASHTSPFVMTDFGRGRVCVEMDPKITDTSINEGQLGLRFEESLRALCAERAVDEMSEVDIPMGSLSLDDVPKAPITLCETVLKSNPVLAKGQRALSELKNGIVVKQQQQKDAKDLASNALKNDGTKMSLLDRIRFKQLAKSQLPLPPSGPELERRAALQRVKDVAAMVSMLSLAKAVPRQSFTMTAILEKLKDSLRMPISKEEGANCVRLLAREVAPEWIKVVTIGGKETVVVQRSNEPIDMVIQERVGKLSV